MVDGQLSMVNGQWSMVNGQWWMVNGQWSMVNGHLWIVNCQWWGVWSVGVWVWWGVGVTRSWKIHSSLHNLMCYPSKIKGNCIITHIYVYICIIYPFSFLCFHWIYSIDRLGHPEAKKKIAFAKKSLAKKKSGGERGGALGVLTPPFPLLFFFRMRFFCESDFVFRFWMT